MKKLITLFSLCFCISTSAQEFKTESSKVYEKSHPNEITHVAFATAYGFSTYSYLENVFMDNQKEITINKYDQKMDQFGTKRFNLPKLDLRAADLNKVIELENELIFISNSMSKKKGIREIYAQVYNNESGEVSEAKTIASYPIEKYSKSGQVQISYSEDKNKIVVFANMPFVKKTNSKIKVWTFDAKLSKIWESSHELNLLSERAHNQDVHVGNDGTVYVVKRHQYNSKKASSNLITINGDTKEETIISAPNFFVRNTTLVNIGLENQIVGFYDTSKVPYIDAISDKGNATSGLFLYSLDSKKIIGQHLFDTKIPGAKDLSSVMPIFATVLADDIFIVAEKQTYTSKFKSDKSTDLDYLYTHGPTLIANLDTTGTLKDMSVLMNQSTYKNAQNERASTSVLPLNGGLKLFYNKNTFTISSFYNTDKTTWMQPPTKYNESQSVTTTYLVPKSLKRVRDFNMIYFVSTNGKNYWLNRMTWE